MKSKEMGRVVTAIPLDLVIEILSWLPARSLLRFRPVCKLWLSITSDPKFIHTNLDRSRKSRPPSVLLFRSHYEGDHCRITVMDDDPKRTPDRVLIVPRSPVHRSRSPDHRPLCMTFPCNGLVCISDHNGYIELLNPTTGERHIPPPCHTRVDAVSLPSLGFHPETKEYKVVRFCMTFHEKWCEVYTLGTNSWRQIPEPDNHISRYKGANANGALYWQTNINSYLDRGDDVLVSFDLKNERFAPISPPDFASVYPEKRYEIQGVIELQNTICLLVYPNSIKRTDIWMMALSDTTTHKWALKYSLSFIAAPLFIHNQKILVSCSDCHQPKSKDKHEPPALVYHRLDCKDGSTTQVYRDGKLESPLICHYLKGQYGSNFEEYYRNNGIHSSQSFAHVESLVSLRNQRHL